MGRNRRTKARKDDQKPTAPGTAPDTEPFDYARLNISSPLEEFETYAREKIKVLTAVESREVVDLHLEALDLGRKLLTELSGPFPDRKPNL